MPRPGRARRTDRRPDFETLEGRTLLTGPTGVGFLWAVGIGVTGRNSTIRSNAVATDTSGATYLTGSFRGTVGFDPGSPTTTVTSAGTQDAFVAKYAANGSLVWAITFAGEATTSGSFTTYAVSQGTAIAVDASGSVFVAGGFSGTVGLSSGSATTRITSPSSTEPFVAKLDASGNLVWVDAIPGTIYDTDQANALALDGAGGLVIAGSFQESATFGSTILTSEGSSDAFVARLDGSGGFLWAVATRGMAGSNAQALGLVVDSSGNVGLAGFLSGTVDFDPSGSSTNLTSQGSYDAALWRLDSSGRLVWAHSYGSTDFDVATAVAVDGSGNFYATGAFSGTVDFGTVASPDPLTAGPVYNAFLLKVSPGGAESWARGLIGPGGSSKGQGVAVDPSGLVHLGGTFQGLIDFDPGGSVRNLSSVASSDLFVAGYTSAGALSYALQAGQTNFNAALGLAVNPSGVVAATGTYSGSIGFGATTLPVIGVGSIFVTRVTTQVASPPPPSSPILEAASDTGISSSDRITSTTSPVLDVLSSDPTNVVQLLRDGVVVGTRTGPGAILDPGPVTDGTHVYTAVQVAPGGLASAVSPATSITVLTARPPALPAPSLVAADDSGVVGDGLTNIRRPRLAVVARGGTTVQLIDETGEVLGSTYQASDGTCLLTPDSPLRDGLHTLQARAVDVAGNLGTVGVGLRLTVDTTAPTSPTGLGLLDDSGALGDRTTNVRQPRLSGRAEAGSTARLVDGSGQVVGSSVVAPDGSFTIRLATSLADGTYVLAAQAVDPAGNLSLSGASLSLTILATPPPAPSAPTLLAADVTGPAGGTLTSIRQPRLVGTARPGTTVQLKTSGGVVVASATAGLDGSYTARVASPLADGLVVISAQATDLAGNVSPSGPGLSLTIDGLAPTAPSTLTLVDDSATVGDNLTNVRQPRLSGRAEAGSTARLVDGSGQVVGSGLVSLDGSFTIRLATSLADGTYVLAAQASDAAGNLSLSGTSLSLTILATPPPSPPAPTLLAADQSGGVALTNLRQPRLTGQTIPRATIQLLTGAGALLASTIAGADGTYLVRPTSPLADGVYAIRAVATDAAGNVGPAGSSFALTILATPPGAPSAPTLLTLDDSGTAGDRITNVRQPRLTATAGAGLTVRLVNAANVVLGTTTAAGTGAVTITPANPLPDGPISLRLVAVDLAGNPSVASGSISLTILATPPPKLVPPSLILADDTGLTNDGLTTVRRPRVVESSLPGARVDWIAADGSVFASATANASTGSYTLQPRLSLPNGVYPVKVRQVDVAGNTSPISLPFNLTVRVADGDYFGDARTDLAVFRTSDAGFFIQKPASGILFVMNLGGKGDVPVKGDFFGNGHVDVAVYRPSNSTFYVSDPVTKASLAVPFGQAGDVPVPADYDGDGLSDFAVFRSATNTFFIRQSASGVILSKVFAVAGDVPVPADYFGTGHAAVAVYRPSTATFYASDPITNAYRTVTIGSPGGTPVPADYEGTGRANFAVFQGSTATFSILMNATNTVYSRSFGGVGDAPVPGDYFGNGRADLAVFRPSTATFYALDIPTGASRVNQFGSPLVMRPLLAPITTWFAFNSGRVTALSIPGSASASLALEPGDSFSLIGKKRSRT